MINNVVLVGRLTKEPAISYSKGEPSITLARFTFVAIQGSIRTGSFTNKDGQKIYTTDVVVSSVQFLEKRVSNEQDGFMDIPDNIEEGLPFN